MQRHRQRRWNDDELRFFDVQCKRSVRDARVRRCSETRRKWDLHASVDLRAAAGRMWIHGDVRLSEFALVEDRLRQLELRHARMPQAVRLSGP